ncbi:hypothetical protein OAD66_01825 [Bacteroidia bacterium]|nr:hypothetical protein [Bacteroidia bacterium]
MSTELFEVRLRFKKLVPELPEAIAQKVKDLLAEHPDKIVGRITHNLVRIRIPEKSRHFWSPQLSLTMEETGMRTEIRGLYGPKPDIWLGYMFTYFFLGFVTLVVSIIGFSRYNLGLSSYILWLIPFVLGGVFVLWATSRAGQKLGKDEVNLIHSLIKPRIFENAGDVED